MLVLGGIGKAQRLAVAERVDDAKGEGLACVLRIRIDLGSSAVKGTSPFKGLSAGDGPGASFTGLAWATNASPSAQRRRVIFMS